jgi:hypothetical protein
VFLADVKGDLSGLAEAGSPQHKLHEKLVARAGRIGFDDFGYQDFPVLFWDLFGQQGHPVRTTVTEMGPVLLARLLELNETQEGVLNIAFRVAEEQGLALLDLKDLQAILVHVGDEAKSLSLSYGNVSRSTVGTILRRLLVLENQGASQFFGEPALELSDMIATTPDGRGRINILAAEQLMQSPRLYSTFLLWLLSELFETLPEIGDPERPTFVFFFDEAHLLFADAPKALIDKVEQVARLIRSKGVGVYFVTQQPDDVPQDILAQLGNRVQHALRAFTPRDRKALKQAAETFRPNPSFDTQTAIMEVGVGEAVVSVLQQQGVPSIVERTLIRPPSSRLGPCDAAVRQRALRTSPVAGLYETAVDRESAFELLRARAGRRSEVEDRDADREVDVGTVPQRGRDRHDDEPPRRRTGSGRPSDSMSEAILKSVVRSAGSQLGRSVVRSLMRGLFR